MHLFAPGPTCYPVYTAFVNLMTDIGTIAHSPVAPYSPCMMPRVSSFTGYYPLATVMFVGLAGRQYRQFDTLLHLAEELFEHQLGDTLFSGSGERIRCCAYRHDGELCQEHQFRLRGELHVYFSDACLFGGR